MVSNYAYRLPEYELFGHDLEDICWQIEDMAAASNGEEPSGLLLVEQYVANPFSDGWNETVAYYQFELEYEKASACWIALSYSVTKEQAAKLIEQDKQNRAHAAAVKAMPNPKQKALEAHLAKITGGENA